MTGPKGSGCPLAMHEQLALLSADHVRLDLAGVVGNIKQKAQVAIRKVISKDSAGVVTKNLAISERAIDGRAHRTEITLADVRIDRRTGELAIGQLDAESRGGHCHFLEELGSDLVTQPAGAAMNGDDNIV